jgi:RNA polymerase sigma factor (sigma-70 family)
MSQAAARIADDAFDNLITRPFTSGERRLAEQPSLEEIPPHPQKLNLTIRHRRLTARTDRDKAIEKYLPLAKYKCRRVALADRKDAIQACMERLTKEYDRTFDVSRGPFDALAAQAIEWGLQDFKKELRGQVPVNRSINLNDPAMNVTNAIDDDNNDNPPPPEQPDMMNSLASLEKQANEAKRRLITERLGCLNSHEQHVIEARLALNGYKEPVRLKALAIQLDVDEKQVRRIQGAAVKKLAQAVT